MDEMVGWHHRLNGHEFEQLWELVEEREDWRAQSMGHEQLGMTEWLDIMLDLTRLCQLHSHWQVTIPPGQHL